MSSVEPAAPGRTQLLDAALELIGERGLRAATVRAVADRAGVTPGLVVHHFGTKERLAGAVDELVLERLSAAMAVTDATTTPGDAAQLLSDRLSATISSDPNLRQYVRRAILEASPAGRAIIDRMIELTIANLREHANEQRLPTGRDLRWLAVQIVTLNLAGTLLEPLLEPVLGGPPFAPEQVEHRTAANLRFITAALDEL